MLGLRMAARCAPACRPSLLSRQQHRRAAVLLTSPTSPRREYPVSRQYPKGVRASSGGETTESNGKMNIRNALMKEFEGRRLGALVAEPVTVLEGIGEKREAALADLGIKTIQQLGNWKHHRIAKAIVALAATEAEDAGDAGELNLNKALCKAYEKCSLKEVVAAPPSALEGLTEKSDEALKMLNIDSVGDLGTCKWAVWAEAIVILSAFDSDHS
mmetsp:Transcript_36078/g.64518  ORF Transcript_36078/g.64518 Transcript_36078/m.64518 type:complete len:215 (-) Transcript_36078:8-652(-)